MRMEIEYYENGNLKSLKVKSFFISMQGSLTGEEIKFLSKPEITVAEEEEEHREELMRK